MPYRLTYCSDCLIFARLITAAQTLLVRRHYQTSQSAVNDVILNAAANIFCEIIEKLTISNYKLVLFLDGNAAIVILKFIEVIRIG